MKGEKEERGGKGERERKGKERKRDVLFEEKEQVRVKNGVISRNNRF